MQKNPMFIFDEATELSVLAWLQTLDASAQPLNSIADLKSGYILMEILMEIDSLFFSKTKKKMVQYVEGNKALIYKNLKTLSEDISKYYSEVLKIELKDNRVEIFSFAKESDIELIINLVELTLFIILKSKNSEKFIEPITKMPEIHQAALMQLIQNLIQEFTTENAPNPSEIDSFIKKEKKLLEKLDELEVENMQLHGKIAEISENLTGKDKKITELNEILVFKNNEVKNLVKDKEKLQIQIEINNLDNFQKNLDAKDAKISDMSKYIEELTLTYEKKISALEEELSQEKSYSNKLQKLEQSLDYYKSKYEDYAQQSELNKELLRSNDGLKAQTEELQKRNDFNELKISKYMEKLDQIQVEKLNLELEISKNNSELLRIKQEITEFTEKTQKKEAKISELQQKLNSLSLPDNQKASLFLDSSPRNLKNELRGMLSEMSEGSFEMTKGSYLEKLELVKDELLQKDKEIKHLMEKCKEFQNENSDLRMKGEKLTEEIRKLNGASKTAVGEVKRDNRRLMEEMLKINEEKLGLEEKINCLNKNEEIIHELEEENRKLRTSLNEKQKQISLIFEKNIALEKINRKNTLTQKLENQQKKELEALKANFFLMENRYKKSLDMKLQENELLITTLYDLRIKFEPYVNMATVLRDRNNNVLKC